MSRYDILTGREIPQEEKEVTYESSHQIKINRDNYLFQLVDPKGKIYAIPLESMHWRSTPGGRTKYLNIEMNNDIANDIQKDVDDLRASLYTRRDAAFTSSELFRSQYLGNWNTYGQIPNINQS